MSRSPLRPARDKLLFTPGPLTSSMTVKQAMLRDLGSRDEAFIRVVREIREKLLALAGVGAPEYAAIPLQGSGTFGLEAMIGSAIPRDGKLLVLVNGAYGRRLAQIAARLSIPVDTAEWPENKPVDAGAVAGLIQQDPAVSHVAVCHCETTSGVMNPVAEIGRAVREAGRCYMVDSMSAFGAAPVDMEAACIDYLVSSSNKCIEGVPGFCFVIARLADLEANESNARSVCLDLLAQHRGLEGNGQFRFTPPTHAMLAFHQALVELEEEGGPEARGARYHANHETLLEGMAGMGFTTYVAPADQSDIITTFPYPAHPKFDFETFYNLLNERGHVIYPGKVTDADCFRIGSIGRLFPGDVESLLGAIANVLQIMGVTLDGEED